MLEGAKGQTGFYSRGVLRINVLQVRAYLDQTIFEQ